MKKITAKIVADDLGYSSVKADIDGEQIKQPSLVAKVRREGLEPVDHEDEALVKSTVDNLFNRLDVSIDSDALNSPQRYLVGNAAQNSSLHKEGLKPQLTNHHKSQTDLAIILPLTFIAAKTVKEAYENGEDIFQKDLSADVIMATALPINEASEKGTREKYSERFTKGKHIVNFRTFDSIVSVKINFVDVNVRKEGEIAIGVAIPFGPKELREAIKRDVKKFNPDRYASLDELIKSAKDIMGIDIGSGTADMPLITAGVADLNHSYSLTKGYGDVLNDAFHIFNQIPDTIAANDIIEFQDILNDEPLTPAAQDRQEKAKQAVNDATPSLIDNIRDYLADALNANRRVKILYIFGGGSIPLMENTNFREELQDALNDLGSSALIIWVGKDYAQSLNEIGLDIYAQALAKEYAKK